MARKPKFTASALPAEQRSLLVQALAAWQKTAEEAAALSLKETELRLNIVNTFFGGAGEGTNTLVLEDGKELKADIKFNRKVETTQLDGLRAWLAANANNPQHSNRAAVLQGILDACVEYKPSVIVGNYKELDDDAKKLIADVITEKPGTPGLKIHIPPK